MEMTIKNMATHRESPQQKDAQRGLFREGESPPILQNYFITRRLQHVQKMRDRRNGKQD